MVASHFHWMVYYGNHALIGGVPTYCLVQNGGMFAVVAWVLGWLMPHIRGWRWILVPFAVAAALPVFALLGTFPAYIAIAARQGARRVDRRDPLGRLEGRRRGGVRLLAHPAQLPRSGSSTR
jgi:hypothetical protein